MALIRIFVDDFAVLVGIVGSEYALSRLVRIEGNFDPVFLLAVQAHLVLVFRAIFDFGNSNTRLYGKRSRLIIILTTIHFTLYKFLNIKAIFASLATQLPPNGLKLSAPIDFPTHFPALSFLSNWIFVRKGKIPFSALRTGSDVRAVFEL